MRPPPSIDEPIKAVEKKQAPQRFRKLIGKGLCRLGIHKETEFSYVDSHGGDDGYCGCKRCGRILG